ncbi:uncharacterized protein LOC116260470 isoform X2 [Nymphaea colorata]|uniref:uncharacterized protein LOC116260470 isoform X2 n=1 Tax=Nymphaea colorata TaxID=210225 RepID=UPI00129EC197|nr:uncharacterized protein LOC116260470 isoform X2 [Nymphaea colorata]
MAPKKCARRRAREAGPTPFLSGADPISKCDNTFRTEKETAFLIVFLVLRLHGNEQLPGISAASALTMDDKSLVRHLLKLLGAKSTESLEEIIQILWSTRKTGLKSQQRTHVQCLLGIQSPAELDPVLACLRLLIRKCARESLCQDEIQKLLPSEVPLQLQNDLVLLLQKCQARWKEDASNDHPMWPNTRVSYQAKVSSTPALALPRLLNTDIAELWPCQDDVVSNLSHVDIDDPAKQLANQEQSFMACAFTQQDGVAPGKLVFIPSLKSMTWTIENQKAIASTRVAIITLKLQDYSRSPSGEREVKFQVSKDNLDAMLRSMAYISEKLSNVDAPAEQMLKKQRQ